jgi:hypothetical protein
MLSLFTGSWVCGRVCISFGAPGEMLSLGDKPRNEDYAALFRCGRLDIQRPVLRARAKVDVLDRESRLSVFKLRSS